MEILEQLQTKAQESSDNGASIESQLFNLASYIEKSCRQHLKRVMTVLAEFDLHDSSHSEKVLENIEKLLGNTINNLSSYELFLLHLSPFLHDCAMAPAEWELKLMELTEGTEEFWENDISIKNDLKPPFKLSEAIDFIEKTPLYNSYEEASQWLFSPSNERKMVEELSELLIDYQSYRNGHKDKICKLKSISEFKLLNNALRTSFIRDNHHIRVEKYIKNLSKIFEVKLNQAAWGKKLAKDLAKICRSHCENITYINDLDIESHYFGADTANLQMVAMLLRLGDIIHFSFDRAPIEIRASKVFESIYSFHEWAVKNNGVNYTIENGLISFKAFCETPKDYFKIHEYIDWIDAEVQNYFRFERNWKKVYISELKEKVSRDGVKHDEDVFFPVRDLKFKLNQKQILELLMGVGLYKDKYSCLRELYQNALDACRCLKSVSNLEMKNSISFGLEREVEGVYLYCQDNGIGMTKNIIQDYLLNIGNSYYKSSDFFKLQVQWNGTFTPTSQFGIGILSCFMIGSRIDIVTRSKNEEVISCSIDGPFETFYYKTPTRLDVERVGTSGTIVKILLSNSVSDELVTTALEYPELLQLGSNIIFGDEFKKYENDFIIWKNHLFNKINSLICSPTQGIKVDVKLDNGATIEVGEKPYSYHEVEEVIEELPFIDSLVSGNYFERPNFKYSEVTPFIETYKIFVEHQGIQVTCLISLPKKSFPFDDVSALYVSPFVGVYGVCIDGIAISHNVSIDRVVENLSVIERLALVNFTGDIRPQLSVDRTSVTSWPSNLSVLMNEVTKELVDAIIEKIKFHNQCFDLDSNSKEVNLIWNYIFNRFEFASSYLINGLMNSNVGNVIWDELCDLTVEEMTIKKFIDAKELIIYSPNKVNKSKVTEQILMGKLLFSESIHVSGNKVMVGAGHEFKLINISSNYGVRDSEILIASSWEESVEYDLISDLLPLIPDKLFFALQKGDSFYRDVINDRGITINSYSNGIGSLFKQDPLMINESMGIYTEEFDRLNKGDDNKIYCFVKKRTAFWLSEINSRTEVFEEKKRNVLFVFVSPRVLSCEEEQKLSTFLDKDPEYVKGVREGWSILFTGTEKINSIIKAGLQSRADMIKAIPEEFWLNNKDTTFLFLDGTEMKK